MKIAIFFKNSRVSNVDASKPELGNPGFGGRQIMSLNIAYYIYLLENSNLEPILYCEKNGKTPQDINKVISGNLFNAMSHANTHGVRFFILDTSLNYELMDDVISHAENIDLDIIFLLSLIPSSRILKRMNRSASVRCIICIEQFAFELIRDHPAFDKTTVLTYGIPVHVFGSPLALEKRKKHVVYVGSLVPQKGFGMLAKVWKKIISKIPDAELFVCGLGTLYGADNKLGQWGVASENYESKSIRPYLSDSDGEPIKSVHFLGNVGHEKIHILKKALVGVANPTGLTETFCLSAVEIQAAGIPVIAGARDGLFDTVQNNKTGYLIKNQNDLTEKIIYLLKNPDKAVEMGRIGNNYVREKYDMSMIAKQWDVILNSLAVSGNIIKKPKQKKYPDNYALKIVSFNSNVKKMMGSPNWWPSYMDYTSTIRAPIAVAYNKMKKYYKEKYRNI